MGYNQALLPSPTHYPLLPALPIHPQFIHSCLRHFCVSFQTDLCEPHSQAVNMALTQLQRKSSLMLIQWQRKSTYYHSNMAQRTDLEHKSFCQFRFAPVILMEYLCTCKAFPPAGIVCSHTASQSHKSSMSFVLLALLSQQQCDQECRTGLSFR